MVRLVGVKNSFVVFVSRLLHADQFTSCLSSQLLNHKFGKLHAIFLGAFRVIEMLVSSLFSINDCPQDRLAHS